MAQIETWFSQDLKEAVKVHYLDGNVFSQDNSGNLVGVIVSDGGEAASLAGSVSGSVIRADGATVALSGTLDGNKASVTLPQAAYAIPGVISIIIKLTNSGVVTTLCAAVANVYQTSTDTAVDPGTIIPDISALIAAIDAAVATIPADYSTLQKQVGTVADAVTDDTVVWASGTINATSGANATATNRIRTTGYLDITPLLKITVPSTAKVVLRAYTSSNVFVSGLSTWYTNETFLVTEKIATFLSNHPDAKKMRLVAAYSDDATVSDVDALAALLTIDNGKVISTASLKNTLDNLVDSSLSVSGKAADAATVGTALYRNKSRDSNTTPYFTFWRYSVDEYGSSNPFSPLDMPNNAYTYALGSEITGDFFPASVAKVSGRSYWIFKLVSTANVALRLYIVMDIPARSIYIGRTTTANTIPTMYNYAAPPKTPAIMMFGDSITRGINSDNSSSGNQSNSVWSDVNIPNLVTAELGVPVDNYGIGSIGWLKNGGSNKGTAIEYLQRVNNSDWYWDGTGTYVNNKFIGAPHPWSYYNTVILAYGANDRAVNSTATTLGSLSDIDDTMTYAQVMAMTPSTIVEAIYQCYRYIREQAPTINIIISDPLIQKGGSAPEWSYPTRWNPNLPSWSWYELCDMYAAFAKKYGLGHISNYDAPINRVDVNISLKDDVHPTTDCYRQLARHFAGKIAALVN